MLRHQQQQQQQGGGGVSSTSQMLDQSKQVMAEAASPISSRPPAAALTTSSSSAAAINFDELVAAGEDTDRGGGTPGGSRWPRQETLALLKIRSDMDVTFRDATVKGPLWDEVSRKLADLGYVRSAKKCKEKFENVQKYYKRTKEGRAGRQDGKSYRFFSQLEALHGPSSAPANADIPSFSTTQTIAFSAPPVSVSIGNASMQQPTSPPISATPMSQAFPMFGMTSGSGVTPQPVTAAPLGIIFSSDGTSSASSGSGDEDDESEEDLSQTVRGRGQKRKRGYSGSSSGKMMEFFEGLMKQVMQKQEAMQQRFLEVIEKREQERMVREEAWKRQEMARVTREHELLAQERNIAASRDAAIVSFLQKITGQTIQLPQPITTIHPVHVPAPIPTPPPPQQPVQQQPAPQQSQKQHTHHQTQQQHRSQQQHQQQHQQQQQQTHNTEMTRHQQPVTPSTEIIVAKPEQAVFPQEISAGGSSDPTSSRWPKAEVLALIKLRSGLEARYQEVGPKGPLWEEISAGMQRMGYKRNAKRCKEKWENINKYFKKVKESNKKRPEDAKTCPYFHELDTLYRQKIIGNVSTIAGSSTSIVMPPPQQQQQSMVALDPATTTKQQDALTIPTASQTAETSESRGGLSTNLFGEGSHSAAGGDVSKPEDIVMELMEQQQQQQQRQQQPLSLDEYDPDSVDNLNQGDDENYSDTESGEGKMGYKIEFQTQNTNGGGNGATSFVTMVQ